MNIKTKSRIEYLDAMRGFCMILVVYSHLGIKAGISSNVCSDIFATFHMPLFFFLSGILSYSASSCVYSYNKLRKRLLGQLLPTIFMGSLFIIFMLNSDFYTAVFHQSKAGYWFTLVAFEIYLLYSCLCYLTDKMNSSSTMKVGLFITVAALFLVLSYVFNKYGVDKLPVYRLFSMISVVSFTPFFLSGVLAKMYNNQFKAFVENPWAISGMIFIFVSLNIIRYTLEADIKLIFNALPGIILVYMIFHNFKDFFSTPSFAGRILSYIGKRTLPIYLLHYFLLSSVAPHIIIPAVLQYCGWFTGLISLLILSIIIISGCLLVEVLFRKATPLYRLLFGYPN